MKLQTKRMNACSCIGGNEIYTPLLSSKKQCPKAAMPQISKVVTESQLLPYRRGKYFYAQASVLCIACENYVHTPACPFHHLLHIPPVCTSIVYNFSTKYHRKTEPKKTKSKFLTSLPDKWCTFYRFVWTNAMTNHSKSRA